MLTLVALRLRRMVFPSSACRLSTTLDLVAPHFGQRMHFPPCRFLFIIPFLSDSQNNSYFYLTSFLFYCIILLEQQRQRKETMMSWSFDNTKPIYLQIMEKSNYRLFPMNWNPINSSQPWEIWRVRLGLIPIPFSAPCLTSSVKDLYTASGQLVDLSPRIWTSSFSPANNFPRRNCNNSSLACFNLATKRRTAKCIKRLY